MSIAISFEDGLIDSRNEPVELNDKEKRALQILEKIFIDCEIDFSLVHFERRSDNYLSVITNNKNDFFRIKCGKRSLWFSLDLWVCSDEIKNDSRLSAVKNKNQRHWKIILNEIDDLQSYCDIIANSYKSALTNH